MYLRALNNGLIVLEPSIEFLSVDNVLTNSCQFHVVGTCFRMRLI